MVKQRLLCCGSSIYLKNKFGIGYTITIVKNSSQVSSQPIIQTIKKHIAAVQILSDVSSELSLQLPIEEIKKFSSLFNQLDLKQSQLKISEYGISITTLQEVFLKVNEMNEDQQQIDKDEKMPRSKVLLQQFQEQIYSPPVKKVRSKKSQIHQMLESSALQMTNDKRKLKKSQRKVEVEEIERQRDQCSKFRRHFSATFLKRLRIIKRDVKTFLFQLLLPLIVIVGALFLMKVSFFREMPALTMDLDTYLIAENPLSLPLGSSNAALLSTTAAKITTKYGSKIDLSLDNTATTVINFDYNFVFRKKILKPILKGGIFLDPSSTSGANTYYPFNTLINTKIPTGALFLPTLAYESIINTQFNKNIKITAISHPLPYTSDQLNVGKSISGFLGAFVFSLALAFKFSSIISFIVKERNDKIKHQQIVSGMKMSAYWFANFTYDYILYLIVAGPSIALCKVLDVTTLVAGQAMMTTTLLFLGYGLAYIPFTYIVAFLFTDYGSAQAFYFFITLMCGGMLPIITLVMRIISSSAAVIGVLIARILRIIPSFAFGQGVINIGTAQIYGKVDNTTYTSLSFDVGLGPIVYIFASSMIYVILLFMIQGMINTESIMRFCSRESSIEDTTIISESDVAHENVKAIKADPQDYQILTKHLRKVYMVDGKKKYKVAVDSLSFGIKKGEVFGLLGVNGAGKSTTFKILSGQITSTSGDSYFCGLKISENLAQIRTNLGYCPQFDALVEMLSVRQQIQLYYDLKSLAEEYKQKFVTQKIKQLNLQKYEHKLSGTLSGGNKRKLSVAIAMIGNPKILFLDEPSTGMDPKARRFMWKVISQIATEKKASTIILTTHSMEEAQALSTRLAIMVKGNFQCIGSPQHIKSKYGEGMQIQLKFIPISKERIQNVIKTKKIQKKSEIKQKQFQETLILLNASNQQKKEISEHGRGSHIFYIMKKEKKIDIDLIIQYLQLFYISSKVIEEIVKMFGEVQVLETLQSFMRLKIKRKPNTGKLFDFFQSKKEIFSIKQYTIKQASVQQIFNKFAQNEGEEQQNLQ